MSSSYDFQAHLQCSQRRSFSQTALLWFEVLPELSPALPGAPKVLSASPRCSQTYHNHSPGTPVVVIWDPSYSEGRQECPPRVWYSPEIDASKITLHILSDTPGVFQWLKYILLMNDNLSTIPCNFNGHQDESSESDDKPLQWQSRKAMGKRPSNDSNTSTHGQWAATTQLTSTSAQPLFPECQEVSLVSEEEDEWGPVLLPSKKVVD